MGVGWRRAFCTSIRGDPPETAAMIPTTAGEKEQNRSPSPSPSPRSCAKLSFFSAGSSRGSRSTPTTPRLLSSSSTSSLAAGIPNPNNLRCRTKSKSPDSPRLLLQCDADGTPAATPASSTATTPTAAAAVMATGTAPATKTNPRKSSALFQRRAFSTPSSPRSPSAFGLFKHFTRSRCRICSRSLKASQETPVFTAECSHAFHFPCIAGHVRTNGSLACPVCAAAWNQAPLLSAVLRHSQQPTPPNRDDATAKGGETENRNPNRRSGNRQSIKCHTESKVVAACPKVYDDDEPLHPMTKGGHVGAGAGAGAGAMRFNPIPEAAEEDKDDDEEDVDAEFKDGFISTPPGASKSSSSRTNGLQVSIMPQAALVTTGRRHHNYVIALKVKAPSIKSSTPLLHPGHRAPIDLVTVLDVSHGMTGEKLHMLKRAMRLVISSLGPMDRLSVVAFSVVAGAKRLLPLRRMSRQGQRSARQIVERLVVGGGAVAQGGKGTSIGDALRKATKVLEDRRERNPVATIMLLSDTGQQQQQQQQQQQEDDHNARKEHTNHHGQSLRSPRLEAHGGDLRPSPSPKAANATTRFAHLEIPVGAAPSPPQQQQHFRPALYEDTFAKCVGGLVSVVMQDVNLQLSFSSGEISAVYLCGGGGAGLSVGGNSIRLGDLYAEEERELLVELRVPAPSAGSHHDRRHQLSVKCNYMDPATQQLVLGEEQPLLLPPLVHSGSYSAASLQLRNLFVSTRAVTESRRLVDLHDYATAQHLLSSARTLLLQSTPPDGSSDKENQLVQGLEAELADLQRRRLQLRQQQQQRGRHEEYLSPSLQRLSRRDAPASATAAGAAGEQPLTPTSAWRAAEQLAKVAIMRKSMNRVSDLHGFENARF